jgi:hypothetical protein
MAVLLAFLDCSANQDIPAVMHLLRENAVFEMPNPAASR